MSPRKYYALTRLLPVALLFAAHCAAQAQSTELVSIGTNGVQVANGTQAVVSQSGRYVLFHDSGEIAPNQFGRESGWYLRDRDTRTTELVTRNAAGQPHRCPGAGPDTTSADISADGRFVVFDSDGCNLDPAATTRLIRVYRLDRQQNTVRLIGPPADQPARSVRMDHSGRFVLMAINSATHSLRMYDLVTGEDIPVGLLAHDTYQTAISGDGRKVAFVGRQPGVPIAGTWGQLFLFDRETRSTEWISRSVDGGLADNRVFAPTLNLDGSVVVFESWASNLVAGVPPRVPLLRRVAERRTEAALLNSAGQPVYGDKPSISDGGNRIAFRGGGYAHIQALVHDIVTRRTTLVSQNNAGQPASLGSSIDYCEIFPGGAPPCLGGIPMMEFSPTISGNGRFVGFHSFGTNLVSPDANGSFPDVYLRDLGSESSGIPSAAAVPVAPAFKWVLALLMLVTAALASHLRSGKV